MRGMIKNIRLDKHGDETTNVSLYCLRAQIIREGIEGLHHVEALMRLRGLDPEAIHVPKKNKRRFRNGGLRTAVLGVLRQEPHTTRQVAEKLDCESRGVGKCLRTLEVRGVVRREGRVWVLPKNNTGA